MQISVLGTDVRASAGATSVPPMLSDGARRAFDPDAAVAAAYEELGSSLRTIVHRATRDPELAADAIQEAFARLLREARAGRFPTHPRAWLYRTAMNFAVSRHRRLAVARRSAARETQTEPPQPEAIVLECERSSHLRAGVARLHPSERTALLMTAAGATGEEIAAHLGRTHGATRSLIYRARARLRQLLEEEEAA